MCQNCIRLNVDISSGIQREATIHFCKGCERYLQPPSHWVRAELESKELLAMCLRKLRGLQKVRLIDASFIWTEPHSKRIKLKVKVQDVCIPGENMGSGQLLMLVLQGLSKYVSHPNVRSRICRRLRPVPRLCENLHSQHLAGGCTSAAKSPPQADFPLSRTVDPQAQCTQRMHKHPGGQGRPRFLLCAPQLGGEIGRLPFLGRSSQIA